VSSEWRAYLPALRMIGGGLIDQLFTRMADDVQSVGQIAMALAEDDGHESWEKLTVSERKAYMRRVQFVIRRVGRSLL